MNVIKVFNFDSNEIRTVLIDNEVWFVGKDVSSVLGYSDLNKAVVMHVDDEDKKLNDKTSSSFGQRGATLINQSGVISLVLSSKLPDARNFKRWVTSKVIPSVLKTGSYHAKPLSAMETLQLQSKAILETNERLNTVEEDINDLKENVLLPAGQYSYLVSRINKRVNEVCKAFGKEISQKERGMLYRDINSGIKTIANVKTRTQLQIKHFDMVDNFITDWEPSTSTKTLIRQNGIGE